MIYNLIIHSEELPEGGVEMDVTVEVNPDDNPQFQGRMNLLSFRLSSSPEDHDDGEFLLSYVDEITRQKVRIEMLKIPAPSYEALQQKVRELESSISTIDTICNTTPAGSKKADRLVDEVRTICAIHLKGK